MQLGQLHLHQQPESNTRDTCIQLKKTKYLLEKVDIVRLLSTDFWSYKMAYR